MPKMKTHSGAKKRMKVTGKNKVKSYQANSSHLFRNKSKKAKGRHASSVVVDEVEAKRMKKLLGFG